MSDETLYVGENETTLPVAWMVTNARGEGVGVRLLEDGARLVAMGFRDATVVPLYARPVPALLDTKPGLDLMRALSASLRGDDPVAASRVRIHADGSVSDTKSDRKPCPFCGHTRSSVRKLLRDGYEKFQDDPDAYAYTIACAGCAAEGGWAKSETGALRLWNTRT